MIWGRHEPHVTSLLWHHKNHAHMLWCGRGRLSHIVLDSFTVHLTQPQRQAKPVVRAVQRDCQWHLKNGRNSHWSREPIIQWRRCVSQSIFRSANHKSMDQLQPVWGNVSYPTGSPTANKLGLCSSLVSKVRNQNRTKCIFHRIYDSLSKIHEFRRCSDNSCTCYDVCTIFASFGSHYFGW